jgi:hypothetical protein
VTKTINTHDNKIMKLSTTIAVLTKVKQMSQRFRSMFNRRNDEDSIHFIETKNESTEEIVRMAAIPPRQYRDSNSSNADNDDDASN